MRLGTLLLRNASIGLSQLESALRNQVLYGGRLGTNLVELGFVEVDLLSTFLAELTGLPAATPHMLDLAPSDVLARLGADLAHQLGSIPLGGVRERDGRIPMAMVDPLDRNTLAALRARLGAPIAPYVIPELRAFYYLERHFGQPRHARFVRSGGRAPKAAVLAATLGAPASPAPASPASAAPASAAPASAAPAPLGGEDADHDARLARPAALDKPDSPGSERRRTQPAAGMELPPPLVVPPRRRRSSSVPRQLGGEPTVAFSAACDRLDAATHRDHLAETLLSYAKGRVSALLLFLVRDANALCWRGYLSTPFKGRLEEISLPLAGASAFQAAHDTSATFSGPPPAPAHPVESRLWEALGEVPEPREVTVVPVILKQRVVNLIYAHAAGGVPHQLVEELGQLAARMQSAYLRLIRNSKT